MVKHLFAVCAEAASLQILINTTVPAAWVTVILGYVPVAHSEAIWVNVDPVQVPGLDEVYNVISQNVLIWEPVPASLSVILSLPLAGTVALNHISLVVVVKPPQELAGRVTPDVASVLLE